jgi:hypothetical protein
VALGDLFAAGPEPEPWNVRVRHETVDLSTRVVADLEHPIDLLVA